MAPSSGNGRTPSLKTYSKRVLHNTEKPSSKRRRVDEPLPVNSSQANKRGLDEPLPVNISPQVKKRRAEEPPPANSSPRAKKAKGATIQSYFKPLQTSSSLITKPASQLSSDPLEPTSTPPSSPPTRSSPSTEYPRKSQKRPKRRLTTRPALAPLIDMSSQGSSDSGYDESSYSGSSFLGSEPRHAANAEGKSEHGSNNSSRSGFSSNIAGPSTKNLYQTQLDVGVPAIKHCKDCGMDYNTTLASDRVYHDKFHKGIIEAKQPNIVPAGVHLMEEYDGLDRHLIRVIDYRAPAAVKEAARKAIDATVPELGGWDQQYNHRDLWALITNPRNETDPNEVPRYKMYLYLINLDVVGVLLVERIAVGKLYYRGPVIYNKNGRTPEELVGDYAPGQTQEFIYNDENYKCHMGIDRIWVHRNIRRKGIASQLLDHARQSFVPGITVPKAQISFSQTTELGRELATKYCDGVFKEGLFLTDTRQPFNRVQDEILHSY